MPHPDDESYAFGGLLATIARQGGSPTLVTCTATPATHRHDELRAAWAALGLRTSTIVAASLVDGALDTPEGAARLTDLFTTWGPAASALCVLGPDGVYGHRDHVAVWRAAVAWRSRAESAPRPLIWPVFPAPERLFAGLRAFLRRTAPELLTDIGPPAPPPHRVVRFPLDDDTRARKRAAMAAHKSQLPKGDLNLFLGRGVVDILSAFESYAIAGAP